jgi:hypothetical protein
MRRSDARMRLRMRRVAFRAHIYRFCLWIAYVGMLHFFGVCDGLLLEQLFWITAFCFAFVGSGFYDDMMEVFFGWLALLSAL